jgi:Helix-turn-helix domain
MALKDLIRDCGMKQGWLAGQLGYSVGGFAVICQGRRNLPIDKLRALAELLHRPVDEVLTAIGTQPETAHAPQAQNRRPAD